MSQDSQVFKTELERQITDVLKQQSMTNRGDFPPFRVPATAQSLAAGVLSGESAAAQSLGPSLAQLGLGLPSLLAAQSAALEYVAGHLDSSVVTIADVSRYFGRLITSFVAADSAELERQRADMERAYLRSVSDQRQQEDRLRSAIRELSTPIIPMYEGILVLPLVGSIDSRRAAEITEQLLEAISFRQAEIVIIDITGVLVIDTSTANHLLMTARAASLLGSQVVLVGIGAEIAQTIVHLGVELRGLVTLANLQAGDRLRAWADRPGHSATESRAGWHKASAAETENHNYYGGHRGHGGLGN